MSNTRLVNLRNELSNLPEQSYPNDLWPQVEAWIAKARPFFRTQLKEYFADFEIVTAPPQWPQLAGVVGEEFRRKKWQVRIQTTDNVVRKILSFLDSIIELHADSANTTDNSTTKIHTGGGSSIGRDVTTEGGSFIGRDSQDLKGENVYSIRADQVVINAIPASLHSTPVTNNHSKGQIKTEPIFAEDHVTFITGNELGNDIRVGGSHHNAPLNVVASSWSRYGAQSWVKSGWLYLPASGLDLAVAFFKLHLRDEGTGYIHILSSANPVHSIWIQTRCFAQEQLFCWDSDPAIQRTTVWHFRWQ